MYSVKKKMYRMYSGKKKQRIVRAIFSKRQCPPNNIKK